MSFEEQSLYPIKFRPRLKEILWGGKTLRENYGKDAGEKKNIGESWEISGIKGDKSVVANGFLKGNDLEEIIEVYMDDIVGEHVYEKFGSEFPLLVKFIDANDTLSVQVHPGDKMAAERHHAWGKTEMWYVLEAAEGAIIYTGFKRKISKEEFLQYLADKRVDELINATRVKPGDVFFIPAGLVHAIGAGVVLAEIQETSDITYRIYDWDRTDANGKSRQLHTDLALDAIDFDMTTTNLIRVEPVLNNTVELKSCEYFKTDLIKLNSPIIKDYSLTDSFVIYMCISSTVVVECFGKKETMNKGQTVLIPASAEKVSIIPVGMASILEIYIPNSKK
jgi:mannose-6-phosphate isomerase